jgi:hypothetical protein
VSPPDRRGHVQLQAGDSSVTFGNGVTVNFNTL